MIENDVLIFCFDVVSSKARFCPLEVLTDFLEKMAKMKFLSMSEFGLFLLFNVAAAGNVK